MARITTIIVATAALSFASGITLGQGFAGNNDPELKAAEQSLDAAMNHLAKSPNRENTAIIRTLEYMARAKTELDRAVIVVRVPLGPSKP